MMPVIVVESWDDFEKQLQEVRRVGASGGRTAEFLFRGLGDSTWELTTTLERAGQEGRAISEHYLLISRLKPQIESFTRSRWEIREWPEIQLLLKEYDAWGDHRFPTPSEYSYMVYLRHHGFPSPLLDWSRSPYVAAFFAFRSAVQPREGKVSIFAFLEMPKGFKVTASSGPQIRRSGAFVSTHRRHFLQQSDYTMCAEYRNVGDHSYEWYFAKHEDVFQHSAPHQDVLWKFNIPWTERLNVLRLLDEYNLNAFSLFESEESLMETLRVRALEFHAHGSIQPAP
jgi:hypothetical protein